MIDINEMNIFVRTKLGQNFIFPQFTQHSTTFSKVNHLRIDMGDDGRCSDTIVIHNKKVAEVFRNDLKKTSIVVYAWKGTCVCYIVKKKDYKLYDYYSEDCCFNGINQLLDLPFLFCGDYCGKGTIEIFTDLLIKCNQIEAGKRKII
jgi:hypothetical protein